ncbi:MAG: tRNA uridine-5-carboxymethylaminomethyl(34) synthesis GTPase MnmE [Firmicutes bacterium]|nr:tRNA uridine-5-carboxymethylaminomethyl(34) synthesis GTPase MnmE [Bacillota bacterium]
MVRDKETIAAISTPMGEGAIGIVRISGVYAFDIAGKVFRDPSGQRKRKLRPWGVRYGSIVDCRTGEYIDEVLAVAMPAPYSFTREDIVEFNCHGGTGVLTKVLETVIKCGARLAEPGEFTKRAFLAGRIDLSQAEAVIDVIRAKTDSARRLSLENLKGGLSSKVSMIRESVLGLLAHIEAAIDFPQEDIEVLEIQDMAEQAGEVISGLNSLINLGKSSRIYRDGVSVVLAGKPNVGKSSLFNVLIGKQRAIVTHIPGTTRDIIDDWTTIKGVPVRLVDTAGMRKTEDLVEKLGVEAANRQAEAADLVIVVIDGSCPVDDEDKDTLFRTVDKPGIIAINKCDLGVKVNENNIPPYAGVKKIIQVSARTGEGIDELEKALGELATTEIKDAGDNPVMVNLRQLEALENAMRSMEDALNILNSIKTTDLAAIDIQESLFWLDQITGRSASDDLMDKIFGEFCIGK